MNEEQLNSILDTPYVPENAGEYEASLRGIIARIPEGWGRWISHDKGWYKIIVDADKMISYIDPDYEIHQVKEKYGTLRFYYQSTKPFDSVEHQIIETIVSQAEHLSAHTCEICGKARFGPIQNVDHTVKLQNKGYWVKTLCSTCATSEGYPIDVDDEK